MTTCTRAIKVTENVRRTTNTAVVLSHTPGQFNTGETLKHVNVNGVLYQGWKSQKDGFIVL